MAASLTRLSCWTWGRKDQEVSADASPEFPPGFREHGLLNFPRAMPPRRARGKWQSREERRRVDTEYDAVIVPSDGECMSGSESDDSDWSIGWMEPHAQDFVSNGEEESSFAVLVPCYGYRPCRQNELMKKHVLDADAVEHRNRSSTDVLKECFLWQTNLSCLVGPVFQDFHIKIHATGPFRRNLTRVENYYFGVHAEDHFHGNNFHIKEQAIR